MLEAGTSWLLACPKGHRVRLYTNFRGYETTIGCAECGSPYRLALPSNCDTTGSGDAPARRRMTLTDRLAVVTGPGSRMPWAA